MKAIRSPPREPAEHTRFEYTNPDTLAGRYLRRFWHPVFVARDLEVGRAVPLRVMGQDLTLYRGQSGRPHLLDARCAHRGAALSIGRVEEECIRCRYHGWKYASSGQCVEQPAEHEGFAHKVRIGSYPAAEYLGLVWAFLGEGTAPPEPRWPLLEGDCPRMVISEYRKYNFFHDLENVIDDVHQRYVHASSVYQDDEYAQEIPDTSAEETVYGLAQRSTFSNGHTRTLLCIMPNCVYFKTGATRLRGFDGLLWVVPVDDVSHTIFFVLTAVDPEVRAAGEAAAKVDLRAHLATFPPVEEEVQAVLSGRKRFEDIGPRPDRVFIEDNIVLASQGVIQDRSKQWLGKSDVAIVLLRKIWAREMAALAEGRPLKQFEIPETLRPT